ncbi:MAG: 4-vinyl reductase [Longimicrobiales bacterium]|nr:4-vinyl reductase [Longimicrobiales bacterium]
MPADATRDVALPAQALPRLRRALREEVGPVAALHGLHAAGYEAGEALCARFLAALPAPLAELPEPELWDRVARFFRQAGWGSLCHRPLHAGVGALEAENWAEATPGVEVQPACGFTTGLLSAFLSGLAGGPVAVLEVSCASRGDETCLFTFGSESTIHLLYGQLLEGASLEDGVAGLTG